MASMAHRVKNFGADEGPERGSDAIVLTNSTQRNRLISIDGLRAAKTGGDVMAGLLKGGKKDNRHQAG